MSGQEQGARVVRETPVTLRFPGFPPIQGVGPEIIAQERTCAKCGHGVMKSWGGWGHAPGYAGKRHVVVVAA